MLRKSRGNAFVMALVTLTCMVISFIASHYAFVSGTAQLPSSLAPGAFSPRELAALVISTLLYLGVILFIAWLDAVWIHTLDEHHYGLPGLLRWAFLGTVQGVLLFGLNLYYPEGEGRMAELWRNMTAFALLFGAYLAVFRLPRLLSLRKRSARPFA